MKFVGYALITIGFVMLIGVFILFIKQQTKIISPVPEKSNVKVLFITPTP